MPKVKAKPPARKKPTKAMPVRKPIKRPRPDHKDD